MKIFNYLIDLVYPKNCMFCNCELPLGYESGYCNKCFLEIDFVGENKCLICGRELKKGAYYKVCQTCSLNKMNFEINYSLFNYNNNVKEMIKRYKFHSKSWYAKYLSEMLLDNFHDQMIKYDYIVHPPINKKTFQKRGYNQMELIAEHYSKSTKKPFLRNCILKTREYEKQSLVKGEDRFKNVRNAFKINEIYLDKIKGKTILIMDDVLTTGATLSECSRTLKKQGEVSKVISMTLSATKDM